MRSSPDGKARNWVAVGPASFLDMLVPLRDEHARRGPAELVHVEPHNIERFLNEFRGERTALLVVEDPNAPSVRDRFASPLLRVDGSNVVVGWLRVEQQELASYARRTAALLTRPCSDERTIALLAPREQRYLDLLNELEAAARSRELISFRWSAERIRRQSLIRALRLGAAAVIYSGHGSPGGWLAYGGLTAQMIASDETWSTDETNAVLFSFSCATGRGEARFAEPADRAHRGFADEIIAAGVAGAVLAPFINPLHAHSRVLARDVVCAMDAGSATLWQILERTERHGSSLDGYAVVGDPAVPMRGCLGAATRGAAVFAPAPDDPLPARAGWGER